MIYVCFPQPILAVISYIDLRVHRWRTVKVNCKKHVRFNDIPESVVVPNRGC